MLAYATLSYSIGSCGFVENSNEVYWRACLASKTIIFFPISFLGALTPTAIWKAVVPGDECASYARKFKMAAGSYTTRRRRADKSHKNGFSKLKHGLSALQEEKLQDFKDSFVEEFEDTPFQVAVLTYLSYFFLILFGYLRDFMRKYGLERSKAPKESGNGVSYLQNRLFTSQ